MSSMCTSSMNSTCNPTREQRIMGRRSTTHARNNLRLALLPPLGNLGVDLVAQLGLDLASVPGKEREEALRAAVDDVDFVQGHGVHDFFAFLDFAFGALDEFCLWAP